MPGMVTTSNRSPNRAVNAATSSAGCPDRFTAATRASSAIRCGCRQVGKSCRESAPISSRRTHHRNDAAAILPAYPRVKDGPGRSSSTGETRKSVRDRRSRTPPFPAVDVRPACGAPDSVRRLAGRNEPHLIETASCSRHCSASTRWPRSQSDRTCRRRCRSRHGEFGEVGRSRGWRRRGRRVHGRKAGGPQGQKSDVRSRKSEIGTLVSYN